LLEDVVPIIVVTRLRVKDSSLMGEFFPAAVALLEQARASAGHLGSDVLADANDVWWTCSAWRDRASMGAYVGSDPHLSTMARLDDWCDEATFVDWEQGDAELPSWPDAFAHLVADGTAATLAQPSEANETRAFPQPVEAT
jgi:quinol monooxygenase YgiN